MSTSVTLTILDAALKMVDDGSENGRQVHNMSALSEAKSKQLVPAGPHQTGVCLLSEKYRVKKHKQKYDFLFFVIFKGDLKLFMV